MAAASPPRELARRLAWALPAAAVLLVLVLALRSSHLQAEVAGIGEGSAARPTPGDLTRARDLLERARRFAPDADLLIREGGLLNFAGRRREAIPPLREAVRLEPDNYAGWALIASVRGGGDQGLAQVAVRRLRELNPRPFPVDGQSPPSNGARTNGR